LSLEEEFPIRFWAKVKYLFNTEQKKKGIFPETGILFRGNINNEMIFSLLITSKKSL
jgi:hypothetical protein